MTLKNAESSVCASRTTTLDVFKYIMKVAESETEIVELQHWMYLNEDEAGSADRSFRSNYNIGCI